jgi:DNA-binding NarL/FixJ family response regulator
MQTVSILLADAQYLIRLGLKHLVDQIPEFEIVAEAKNAVDLKRLLEKHVVDVVVLDHLQSKIYGKDVVQKIQAITPKTNILIISSDDDRNNIYALIESGVNNFLTKQCDEAEIINAIRATAKGEKFFCSKVLNYILEKSFSKPEDCAPSPLSPRECEIVRLVAEGKIAKEIAAELNLSTHTVYTHRKNIMKKLQLSSASELVRYAVDKGLVESN